MNDLELIAAKHCLIEMEETRATYIGDFFETSNNEYAKAFRRHVEAVSDIMRTAVEWIREGKAEQAAVYLQGFILPETIEIDPAVRVFLEVGYDGDKRYLDEATEELEAFQETAARLGLKISFEPA